MTNIDWDELRKAVADIETSPEENKPKSVDFILTNSSIPIIAEAQPPIPDNSYATRKYLLEYVKIYNSQSYKSEDVKNLFKSVFDFLSSDFNHLRKSLTADIHELDACLSARAYKATLILAGSILEAFLLDWLSEIDGKNYFEEPYKVKIYRPDGTFYWEKKEQLNVYIEQIKEIERPDWMESSEKAHYIRERRNSVHAKVCLKEDEQINEETCRKVISYLKDIIDTRLNKRQDELRLK